jgi:hypothetical protein
LRAATLVRMASYHPCSSSDRRAQSRSPQILRLFPGIRSGCLPSMNHGQRRLAHNIRARPCDSRVAETLGCLPALLSVAASSADLFFRSAAFCGRHLKNRGPWRTGPRYRGSHACGAPFAYINSNARATRVRVILLCQTRRT